MPAGSSTAPTGALQSAAPEDRSDPAEDARRALRSRLQAAATVLLGDQAAHLAATADSTAEAAAQLLELLIAQVRADLRNDSVWLLLTALAAAYPTRDEVDAARRRLELDSPTDVAISLLESALRPGASAGRPLSDIDVVTGAVVVDVSHTAQHNLHTGIQRVARSVLPRWHLDHAVLPVAWADGAGALRRLSTRETERVLAWDLRGDAGEGQRAPHESMPDGQQPRLVVPWRSTVVMVEVATGATADRFAALGNYSGNELVGIGYDAIPLVSADLVPPEESAKYARYLTAVKFSHRIAAISAAARLEFAGFKRMLASQGLAGPHVVEVALPDWQEEEPAAELSGVVNVLVVGSHEPRKNHLAVLHAAEHLWRTGLQFELSFVGGSGWGDEFPRLAGRLQSAGRPLHVHRAVSDATLAAAFAAASFTVFPSLHEGYGLPLVESLAHGVPVITSNYGSTAEIAAGGGAITIDPRDDAALTEAMRCLLTEPQRLIELRRQIAARGRRTWPDYAAELWTALVTAERSPLQAVR